MCLVLMLKARPLHTMPYTERPLDVYREMSSPTPPALTCLGGENW